jgi:rRNA maturation endonuclease Nob1
MGVPSRLTEMQRKFSELLILYEGRKFDYECAVEAGYSVDNSRHMASRLQNAEYFPLVVKHIGELREEQRNRFKVNYGRHVTELARIRDSALKHRSFSAAANAEHMRGKASGLYVEQKHILHGKLDEDQNETEMNKEITELLKSNRKIINITPEDIIDIKETDESKQLSPPRTPTKTKSDQDSTS